MARIRGADTINTKILFPLTAALLVVAATSALVGTPSLPVAEASPRIVDLPAITMRPAVEDAAYYQAHKIVDLAAVIVYPTARDHEFFLADTALRTSLACRC